MNAQDLILQVESPNIPFSVLKAQSFIKKNFSEIISISDVARAAETSVRHLSRFFLRETGMTVLDLIHHVRISYAQEQLQSTNKSCLQIALESGFGTVQQFNRVFKKTIHTTPSGWRRFQNSAEKNKNDHDNSLSYSKSA